MAQYRRISIHAKSKDRMTVNLDAQIRVEGGVLTKDEVQKMRNDLADRLMLVMADVPYLHVSLSQLKVSR